MDASAKKGADSQYHGTGTKAQTHLGDHTCDALALDDQIVYRLLEQVEVWLVLQGIAHRRLV